VPRELRLAWLPDAARSALAAEDAGLAREWERALSELNPPGTKP
jgi:hypothetical protein